jgi:RNA-binding protein
MNYSGKERAALRAEAHHISPLAHLGTAGLTPAFYEALDDTLRTKELVKVALVRNAALPAKDAAAQMAEELQAVVVQVIGRTVTLYRHNPLLERKKGDLPPWRK